MRKLRKQFDIISLGECMVEFAPVKNNEWRMGFAGDAYNTLVYAARLGMRCGFITCVGKDTFRAPMLAAWRAENINTTCSKTIDERQNGVYFIHTDARGERHFQYYRVQSAATQTLIHIPIEEIIRLAKHSRVFYFTAISLAILVERERIIDVLQKLKGKTLIVFDANYREQLWNSSMEYRDAMDKILPFLDVIMFSEEDKYVLHPYRNAERIFTRYYKQGIMCCIKSGERGAMVETEKGVETVPAQNISPIDTTAAGDAFNAGYIMGMLKKYSRVQCAELGNAVAGIVIRHRGAIVKRSAWEKESKKLPSF